MSRPVRAALAGAAALLAALAAGIAGAGTAGAAPTLRWLPCGAQQCGTIRVPLHYDRPGSGSLTLALNRVPARLPGRRLGSLVVNFGGPGSSGRGYLVDFVRSLPGEIRDRFDIVNYDPRGVGRSSGLRCRLDVPALLDLDERVTSRPATALLDGGWRLVEPCVRSNRSTIATLGTANAARDLDRLRAALGDAKLTYLGFSYGTRLGSVYADLFPRRIRALVLDGAVSPSVDWRKLSIDSAAAGEASFRRFFRDCRRGCASGPVEGLWRRAVQRLTDEPIAVDGHRVGPAYLEFVASFVLGGGSSELRFLGRLVQRVALETRAGARRDLGAELAGYVQQSLGDGAEVAARLAIDCADTPGRPSDAVTAAFDRALRARYPLAGPTSDNACPRRWPAAVEPLPRVRAAGAPPIVVVGTRHDPITPYLWSVEMARALESAVLLTSEGDTHTSFSQGDACLDPLVTRYLVDATPPRPTTCGD